MDLCRVHSMKNIATLLSFLFAAFCILFASLPHPVQSHGRMMEPPARNTMWRFGFPVKPNYEDSELFCGGIKVQWEDNGGKCGVCGDPFSGPREHETGGFYANNVTVRHFYPGSAIDVFIDIVANHGGFFNFEMCWRNSFNEKETESCFERLKLIDGRSELPINQSSGPGSRVIQVKLPKDRTCDKCVLRWHWKSGNNWGPCGDGTHQVGCGPQETYRNCADIAVNYEGGIRGPTETLVNGNEGTRFRLKK